MMCQYIHGFSQVKVMNWPCCGGENYVFFEHSASTQFGPSLYLEIENGYFGQDGIVQL